MGIHQFSYNERLIHSKRHLKRNLCFDFKENPLSNISLWESLPKDETGISNLDFHQFFCNKRLLHPKSQLKKKILWRLRKIVQAVFPRHALPKVKIWLPILYFHEFFCSKLLIHSKKPVKEDLYIELEKNRSSHFWDTLFRYHFGFALPHSWFFDFREIHLSSTMYKI